jgi:hypothetical protein
MFFVGTMSEVEAHHINARQYQLLENLRSVGGGTDGSNDFGAFEGSGEHLIIPFFNPPITIPYQVERWLGILGASMVGNGDIGGAAAGVGGIALAG